MRKQRLQRFLKQITQILFILLFLLPITNYQLLITNVYAEIPHLISYQGKLVDSAGKPLQGNYKITFKIYDALSGGNLLWEESHQATIDKGVVSVMLGSFNNGSATYKELKDLTFSQPYYLTMQLEGDPEEMSPRQKLGGAGYAFRAEVADGIKGSENIFLGSGNVGIGTTTPGAKLEVQGGVIKATGGIVIETRTSDPGSPTTGQMWLRSDL